MAQQQIDLDALAAEFGGFSSDASPDELDALASELGGAVVSADPRRPASPDDFTERPAAPAGSVLGRVASGAWEMLNPVTMLQGVAGAVAHPIDTARGLVNAQTAELGKARDAFGAGRYSEMLGHAAAGVLPVVGPVAANIGEGIAESGDVATGMGRALGVLAPTGAAVRAGGKVLGAAKGRMPPAKMARPQSAAAAAKQAEAVRWALEQGIPVDAATATGNRVVRGAKAVADSSLGGALSGQRAATARAEALARTGRGLASQADAAPATAETAGAAVRERVQDVIRNEATAADEAYGRVRTAERNAMPDDVPVSRPVAAGRTVDQGFIGHWLADDLQEMGYQAGGGSKKFYDLAESEWRPGDADAARYGIGVGSGRVAGTPTQEMFHAAGVSGSRAEIATKIRRYLNGESDNPRIAAVVDAMGEAWDGQRFDWDLLTDDTLARTGLKRNQFKSPITMPAMEAPGASKFFGDEAPGLNASGTEPMQLAVPLAPAKDALRPVFERLMRKKELTGQLMGDEARAATALDALISGPDNAPLSVVDAALGDLKAAARGAAMPELRSQGQGLAAQAVAELETLVQQRAKAAGVWDDLRAGRDATIAKWTAAETLDKLRAEPVQTFRMLTSSGDAAVERLREVQRIAPAEVPKIGRAYVDGLIDMATAEGGFGREAKLWAEWDKLGTETKAMLYPNKELRSALDNFFLVGKKMAENPNPSGTALVAQVPGQAALMMLEPVSGVSLLIGGGVVSKLLNSPTTARLLTQGMQTPRSAAVARQLASRLKAAIRPSVRTAQATRNTAPGSNTEPARP
jgi:hypothetical protein